MNDHKCSFVATLIKDDFACQCAHHVTRRGGPDIACSSATASDRCQALLNKFKQAGLPAFDAKDDLLETPHSVFAKIQFGGLLGMARDISEIGDTQRVDNIFQLIEQALQRYGTMDDIPCQRYASAMKHYKIQRRGRKKPK